MFVCLFVSQHVLFTFGPRAYFSVSRWTEHHLNSPIRNGFICVFELYSNFCLFSPLFPGLFRPGGPLPPPVSMQGPRPSS